MDISVTQEGSKTTIVLAGVMDRDGADEIGRTLPGVMVHRGGELVVDLQKVHFLGCSGIARFLQIQDSVSSAGGRFRIVHLNPQLEGLFKANHLDKLLQIG
jgi:anti-anti-sigma factor